MKLPLKTLVACTIFSCILSVASAQISADAAAKETTYTKTITERSNKIVAVLGITDSAKFYRIQNILMQQYRNLSVIHDSVNACIRAAKQQTGESKENVDALVKKLDEERTAQLEKLHPVFLASLAKDLTEEQVIKVKDGMTYNVLPITYKAYQEMIPTLTEEQKKQMYAWLVEAREKAIDAESADKKHAWFGKYKGRINNYLSAAGYDMKKEGEEWQRRIAAAKNKS